MDSTLMSADFVASVLGVDDEVALEAIKGCEEAVQKGDQWYLPLWLVEEMIKVYYGEENYPKKVALAIVYLSNPDLVSAKELAEALCMDYRQALTCIKECKEAVKIGRQWFLPKEIAETMIEIYYKY